MSKLHILCSITLGLLLLTALPAVSTAEGAEGAAEQKPATEWSALIPEGWAPQAPDMSSFFHDPSAAPGGQIGADAPVVEDLHGTEVILEGWLVPLEIERAERYHEFLLVPYFGACYHVPPPPANQIVHLFLEEGVAHYDLFEPQRVTGNLRVESQVTDLAAAAYRMVDATSAIAQW